MSFGLQMYTNSGTAVFDSARGDKIQRTVFTTTTGGNNGSVQVPQFDSDYGHIIAYPISGQQFSENARVIWNNSTKTLTWNYYHNNRANTRIFAIMFGGQTPENNDYGMIIKDTANNSLIDPQYGCLAQIENYQVTGGTKPFWREKDLGGIYWDHTFPYVYHSTVSSTSDEADFENNYMLASNLPINGILFPSLKNQDTVEHRNTGSSLKVMKFGVRETLPSNSDYGLVFKNASQDRIIITDQDRYPEVIQTWEFDTLPGVTATTGQKLRLTHESIPESEAYFVVYFNATPLLFIPSFSYGRTEGSTNTTALGIQKISNTQFDIGFYTYGYFRLWTTRSPGFYPSSTSSRFLIPTVAENSNMDLFLRVSLLRLRE